MLSKFKHKDAKPQERSLWGELLALGITFPIAITLGFFLGKWIGGKLGHEKIGQYIGLIWGIATAFFELFKTAKRLDKMDPPSSSEDKGSGGRND